MAVRTILKQGAPALSKVCHPVTNFDERLAILVDDMLETLADAEGVGLAAPQVGILRRVVLVTEVRENDPVQDEKSETREPGQDVPKQEEPEQAMPDQKKPEGEEPEQKSDPDRVVVLINPEIILQEGEQNGLEGCLSVPGMWGYVKRPEHVVVRAQDRDGQTFEFEGTGIVARCICHECEHLDGHMFVEHTDRLYTAEDLEKMDREEQEQAEKAEEEKKQEQAKTDLEGNGSAEKPEE